MAAGGESLRNPEKSLFFSTKINVYFLINISYNSPITGKV